MARDEFPKNVRLALMIRAGLRCSRPGCRAITAGSHSDPEKWLTLGDAGHITAAAEGGPRYDADLTPEQRKDISNGIWLCLPCARLVDHDDSQFAAEELRGWRSSAEVLAWATLEGAHESPGTIRLVPEALQILVAASGDGKIYLFDNIAQITYPIVRAGGADFYSSEDALLGATYGEAFESLLAADLARHARGQLYLLTVAGLRIGQDIAKKATSGST